MVATPELRPGVSVVIPVKDRAHLLEQTLRSVREQTRPVDEIVVVDDGSTDNSATVARDAGATVLAGAAEGPAAARNEGLAHVSTELACPLDSDDLLLPRAIETLTDALARSPQAPFAFGQGLEAAREGGAWHPMGINAPLPGEMEDPLCALYARNFVPSSSVVVRTRDILETGGYPAWLAFNEDQYAWIQLARRAPPVHVSKVLTVTRAHAGSRHDPLADDSGPEITRLADEDPRLLGCRPERLGVQFVNLTTAAIRERRAGDAARMSWSLFLRQRERGRIVRAAFHHWRNRRLRVREADELWSADPELRRLLATYQ